jgi:hypothetical protein
MPRVLCFDTVGVKLAGLRALTLASHHRHAEHCSRSIDVVRTLSILLLATLAPATYAAEGQFQISPRIGRGGMHIDAPFTLANEREEIDALSLGGVLGYATPIGVLLEVGAEMQTDISWFSDEYSGSNDPL